MLRRWLLCCTLELRKASVDTQAAFQTGRQNSLEAAVLSWALGPVGRTCRLTARVCDLE